jgi:CubicO group peptidase (beta-lactamase class C family)
MLRVLLLAAAAGTMSAAAAEFDIGARIGDGLQQRVAIAGEPAATFNIQQRMQRYRVASVSVAVIRNGKIAWAGVYRQPAAPRIDTDTVYQAASISKGIAGALAHRLARGGKLELDAPVDACLKPLALPAGKQSAEHPVTLRNLLSHNAGATVSGFPGYPPSQTIPTAVQVIRGESPSVTPAVAIQTVPGSVHAYSGGGYTIAQVAMEQCLNAPFAELMQQQVLRPLSMRRSSFAQPLPAGERNRARGHYADGSEVEDGALVYPELAAAGLWTTPSDLARFAIALQQSWKAGTAFLGTVQAHDLLKPGLNNYAQGLFVVGEGEHRRFMHSGGNAGFKSTYAMYLESGDGVVVMTDGDNGSYLGGEVVKAVSSAYGWPDFKPRPVQAAPLDIAAARRYVGVYRLDVFEGRYANRYDLQFDGKDWMLVTPDIGATRLVPTGAASLVAPETGESIELAQDGTQDLLLIGGRKAHRAPQKAAVVDSVSIAGQSGSDRRKSARLSARR